ncbi:MAG: phosphatase PAP2 family protein [Paracoccaceae bacterium]
MQRADIPRLVTLLVLAYAAAIALFSVWPELDLMVSALFYREDEGFWLARNGLFEALRTIVWWMSVIVALASIIALLLAALGRPIAAFDRPKAAFVFLLYLLGPTVLANGLLKRFWGRARPADITEFGGTREFTPALVPSGQCHHNCSFVSGEGSGATAMAISLLVLAPVIARFVPRGWRIPVATVIAGLALAGVAMRVMTGRHFLSDTIFAVLFISTIALALYRLLLIGRNR